MASAGGDGLITMQRSKRRPAGRHRQRETHAVPAFVRVVPRERSVLVVEADPELQVQMARQLRREGHRVVGTSSGDGALALIAQWDVDLVLINEDLPGRAGIEVTRLIHAVKPLMPLIVMSTNAEPSLRAAARAAGAVECLLKPLRVESLARWLTPVEFETRERREAREALAE
jgi:CheY-like chemotaxis protein